MLLGDKFSIEFHLMFSQSNSLDLGRSMIYVDLIPMFIDSNIIILKSL